ncbi:MAG: acyltransferase family protein [Faecalimonas umbilicata]|uniref:acyltransferase family protein n=1 Tax=Faecalimonas umbilicata TaxID=1912855 RepID=UPI0039A3E612
MKERVRYFDIAKGVAIFCIIAGHMRNTIINNFVFTFHVPIFFLISGYFLKSNRPFKEFVTKKYNQLIRPYIITCICVIVGVSLSNIIRTHSLEHLVQDVKTWFIASLYGSGTIEYSSPFYMKQIGAIWFLLASFTAVVIVRYFIEYKQGWLGVVVLAYVGYKTGQMVWLPLSIQAGMTAAVFVYLGWLSNKYKLFEHPAPHMWISGAAIIWLFGILFCGKLYVVRNHFENGLFDIVVAVAGSYLVIVICQIIDKQTKYLANLLEFYGKNTLTILCMHEVEILTISWKWVWQIGEKLQLQTYQVIWIILILKMLLFTVGIYIIQFLKKVYTRIKGKIQKKI